MWYLDVRMDSESEHEDEDYDDPDDDIPEPGEIDPYYVEDKNEAQAP